MPKEEFKEVLEVTMQIGCPSNCKYCPQDLFINKYFKKDKNKIKKMTFENFKRYLKSVPKNLRISFAGFSEPLVNDDFLAICKWLESENREFEINTCLYKVKRKILRELIKLKFFHINIHVPDNKNYTDISVDKKYLNNLRFLLTRVKNKRNLIICLGTMHPEIKKLVNKYKDNIYSITEGEYFINNRAGKIEGFNLTKHVKKGPIHCCRTNRNLKISNLLPDGRLVLCCMDFGLEHILGNLNHNTYEEILHGNEAKKIRKNMIYDEETILCRKCEFAVESKIKKL